MVACFAGVDTFTMLNDCENAELEILKYLLARMKAYSSSKMASGNINVISNLIMNFMASFFPLSVRRKGTCISVIQF
jgi:hypothetical protein